MNIHRESKYLIMTDTSWLELNQRMALQNKGIKTALIAYYASGIFIVLLQNQNIL